MKKKTIKLTALLFYLGMLNVQAQTNTFPASGNVGIGTTSPQAALDVSGGNIKIRGGANDYSGWGAAPDNSLDPRPNYVAGNTPFIINNHIGLTFSAHSYYGGIRFYNQGYPGGPFSAANGARMVMSITNNRVGIGTATPLADLDVPSGNIRIGGGADNYYGWGIAPNNTLDARPNVTAGNEPFIINHHTGLTLSAHSYYGGIRFYNQGYPGGPFSAANGAALVMSISDNRVMIGNGVVNGVNPAGYKLYVQTGILTEKVKVAVNGSAQWADYVFHQEYKLPSLEEVEKYIQENKHLPNIPSAEEMIKEGNDLGATDAKLLAKIEELTLYLIEQQKQITEMKNENEKLSKYNEENRKENSELRIKIKQIERKLTN